MSRGCLFHLELHEVGSNVVQRCDANHGGKLTPDSHVEELGGRRFSMFFAHEPKDLVDLAFTGFLQSQART